MLRRLAEIASRRSRFTRRLPPEFGSRRICVSAANQLAIYKPGRAGLDPMLLDLAERFAAPGKTIWDVGANMGLFTFPAAARGARVVSFEPDPFNLDLLNASRGLNPDFDVTVVPAAVAEKIDIATFNIAERGRSTNRLSHAIQGTQTGGVRQTYQVLTINLDWALERLPPPDFVKCDAEGAEHLIAQGARRLIREVRAIWAIEVERENADQVWAEFQPEGYRIFDALQPDAPEQSTLKNVWNALLVPA